MNKDFHGWNRIKVDIDSKSEPEIKVFNEREIWWCSIGHNIGFEQDGKGDVYQRPVLVLRKFSKHSFFGIPLSTKGKKNNPYYFRFSLNENTSYALLSQLRMFDAKRLINIEGTISKRTYNGALDAYFALFSKK